MQKGTDVADACQPIFLKERVGDSLLKIAMYETMLLFNFHLSDSRNMSQKEKVDAAAADVDFETKKYAIELDTSLGKIELELRPDVAPNHCRNMIGLAKIGFYDGLIFHRIIDGFMIQGGCPKGTGTGNPGYNVDAEFNDMVHEEGVLSMARSQDPNSAGSQFFVCLGAHSHLDGSYTAFGKATDESLEVVRKIGNVTTGMNDRPKTDVKINTAQVLENGAEVALSWDWSQVWVLPQ